MCVCVSFVLIPPTVDGTITSLAWQPAAALTKLLKLKFSFIETGRFFFLAGRTIDQLNGTELSIKLLLLPLLLLLLLSLLLLLLLLLMMMLLVSFPSDQAAVVCGSAASSDRVRSNLSFLHRAFGSQLDLTGEVDGPLIDTVPYEALDMAVDE